MRPYAPLRSPRVNMLTPHKFTHPLTRFPESILTSGGIHERSQEGSELPAHLDLTSFSSKISQTVRVDGGDPSTASTTTPRNRAARTGIVVASRRSAIFRRFSTQFRYLFTFFHVS
ncbi:hypothetical protein Y032_0011g1320 [Ancylostoma ceylanicum]|uniref:Uncharacterized protein n=1 Tax=Ancylostoma ceylanicum TaxID=53326 RepID=A0A016VFZ0_9BILA|nr:hypothetical protein Y032_0011g1320 [Ancylostoma ceylanicum]